jgi:hypothetical protein
LLNRLPATVYSARRATETSLIYAAKMTKKKLFPEPLDIRREFIVLRELSSMTKLVPDAYALGKIGADWVMIMSRCGPSLDRVIQDCSGSFERMIFFDDALLLALRMVRGTIKYPYFYSLSALPSRSTAWSIFTHADTYTAISSPGTFAFQPKMKPSYLSILALRDHSNKMVNMSFRAKPPTSLVTCSSRAFSAISMNVRCLQSFYEYGIHMLPYSALQER